MIDDETARLMFNVILVMTLATVGDQTRRPIVLQVRIQSDYVSRRVCRAWSAIGFMVNRIGSYSTQERLFSVPKRNTQRLPAPRGINTPEPASATRAAHHHHHQHTTSFRSTHSAHTLCGTCLPSERRRYDALAFGFALLTGCYRYRVLLGEGLFAPDV